MFLADLPKSSLGGHHPAQHWAAAPERLRGCSVAREARSQGHEEETEEGEGRS